MLQSASKYKLDRVIIGGSLGKKIAINTITTDVQCVVFINHLEPPFYEILSEFEDILKLAEQPITNVKSTNCSVQLTWNGDINLELIPATNFLYDDGLATCLTEEQRIFLQQKLTLAKINSNPSTEKASYYFIASDGFYEYYGFRN